MAKVTSYGRGITKRGGKYYKNGIEIAQSQLPGDVAMAGKPRGEFAVGEKQVTEEEYKTKVAESKILAEGGMKVPTVEERAEKEQLIEKQTGELRALSDKYLTGTTEEKEEVKTELKSMGISPDISGIFDKEKFKERFGEFATNVFFGLEAPGGEEIKMGTLPLTPAGGAVQIPKTMKTFSTKILPILAKLKAAAPVLISAVLGGGIASVLGSLTSGKVSELEGDINYLRTSSRDILTDVATRGGDPVEAIYQIEQIESAVNEHIAALNQALKTDIKARLRNKDTLEFEYRTLSSIILRRHAIERYMLTGDINLLRVFAETEAQEEALL